MAKDPLYLVGDWKFDPNRNLLTSTSAERGVHYREPQKTVTLEPLPSALLLTLARQAGVVFSADELINEVWRGRIIGDNPVYRAIATLRKALCDESCHPVYLETIRKRGYRLIAPVQCLGPPREGPDRLASAAVLQHDPIDSVGGSVSLTSDPTLAIMRCVVVTWVVDGEPTGKSFRQAFTIGRSSTCDIRIYDDTVSRKHVRVFCLHGVWMLRDLNSTNGTMVNGESVSEMVLDEECTLRVSPEAPPLHLRLGAAA